MLSTADIQKQLIELEANYDKAREWFSHVYDAKMVGMAYSAVIEQKAHHDFIHAMGQANVLRNLLGLVPIEKRPVTSTK